MFRAASTLFAAALLVACAAPPPRQTVQWQPVDIGLRSAQDYPWYEFPAIARFEHESGEVIEIPAYWTGPRAYAVRFTPTLAGRWKYSVVSADAQLATASGAVAATSPAPAAIDANPNLRGQIQISPGGRYFTYSDGTPFFLLADTIWAGNTARAGLGEHDDGPFFQYLADRKAKRFSAVLMQMVHGFGDYPNDPTGHANEGGHLFVDGNFERLNPLFFEATDVRWRALWERGWVVASPFAWWGKTRECQFTPTQAQRLAAYFATRYGAFNTLWAVSGEYQYVFRDCGWGADDLDAVAQTVQQHNPYKRPLSIHPSGGVAWDPPHNVQSSLPFQSSGWLDHHWLQTGQSFDRMHNLVSRPAENRALEPPRPVFCSEAYYEHADDRDGAYHARWQAWTAFLNGCAGYGYGAQGLWQFRDPTAAEPGKDIRDPAPWRDALQFPGSAQVGAVRSVLEPLVWQSLAPRPAALTVDRLPARPPSPADISPPQAAASPDGLWVLYVPRDNAGKRIELRGIAAGFWNATWHDPRGASSAAEFDAPLDGPWLVPTRPAPSDEDWVLVLQRGARR